MSWRWMGREERNFHFDEETTDGWYQSAQDGEIITLPETALRKETPREDAEDGRASRP